MANVIKNDLAVEERILLFSILLLCKEITLMLTTEAIGHACSV